MSLSQIASMQFEIAKLQADGFWGMADAMSVVLVGMMKEAGAL